MSTITYFGYPGVYKKIRELSRDVIMEKVCDAYGITQKQIMRRDRKKEIVEARQVAMYLIRVRGRMGVVELGKFFGGMDHSTVSHSVKKIKDLQECYPEFKEKIEQMLSII